MSNNPSCLPAAQRIARGFTLIELMIAMVLGVIVTAGIITLFISTSKANRVQASLAHIQENGRFAVARLSKELRMTNAQYCSTSGGASQMPTAGNVFQPAMRSPQILAKVLQLSDGTTPMGASSVSSAYAMPADMFLQGYECSSGTCSPTAPTTLPDMGTSADMRVNNADVLQLRYLSGDGWSLDAGHSTQVCDPSGNKLTQVVLSPSSTEPPAGHFSAGDLAMLADCSQSQVFAVAATSTGFTPNAANNFTGSNPTCVIAGNGGRLFDFSKDFTTVTYFLELKADDNPDAPAGHLVSVLMRQVNQDAATPLVRGVERFDVRYEVEDNMGNTAILTADQVNNGDIANGGALNCPPGSPNLPAGISNRCLWRAVKAIEVNLLFDSVNHMASVPDGELAYSYMPDGSGVHTPPTTMTNGLDRMMMRRGFSFVVNVRNYNP